MRKLYFQGLTLLYVLLSAGIFLVLLELFGLSITNTGGLIAISGWGLFCFSAAWLNNSIIQPRRYKTRIPAPDEKEKLQGCLEEVLQKAGCGKRFDLRIVENREIRVFAAGIKTIAISRGSLERLTEGELKGLLAHELGHLLSRDWIAAGVLALSIKSFKWMRAILLKIKGILTGRGLVARLLRKRFVFPACLLGLLLLINVKGVTPVITAVFTCCIFILSFILLDYLSILLGRSLARRMEYKQDAFARTLGYGLDLRKALRKSILKDAQQTSDRYIGVEREDMVIVDRIWRLARLEHQGLRE